MNNDTAITTTTTLFPVTAERATYNSIRIKYQKLAIASADDFSSKFSTILPNIDAIHEKCTSFAMGYFQKAVDMAVSDLITNGVMDVNNKHFADEYLGPWFTWKDDFDIIDDKYMSIVLNANELDSYRTDRRKGRGRMIGGGFGLGGALEGAAEAGAMNLVAGMAHGVFNIGAKITSAVGDSMKKSNIYADPTTKSILVEAVYKQTLSIHRALIDALNKYYPNKFSGAVTIDDEKRAMRMFDNVSNGRIKGEDAFKIVLEVMSIDPYNENMYHYLLSIPSPWMCPVFAKKRLCAIR